MSASETAPWPARPSLPLALLAFWAILLTERLLIGWARPWATALAWAIVPAASALATHGVLSGRHRPERAHGPQVVVAVAVVAATLVSLALIASEQRAEDALSRNPVSRWSFEVERSSTPTEVGYSTTVRVLEGAAPIGRVTLASAEPLEMGARLRGVGRFRALGEDEWAQSCRLRGLSGTVRLIRITEREPPQGLLGVVDAVRQAALAAIEPERSAGRALIAAMALGERTAIEEMGLDEAFSRAGLSHVVAVSGAHLAVAQSLMAWALARTRLPRLACSGLLLAFGAGYVALCGAPLSAVRSLAMAMVAAASDVGGVRAHGLGAVGAVGSAMLLLRPQTVGELGFLLSISCVCALGLFSRWAYRLVVPAQPHGIASMFLRALAASSVCTLASLPLLADSLGEASILGPLSSMLITPALSLVLAPFLAAAALGTVPVVGPLVVALAAWVGDGLAAAVSLVGSAPWAQVGVSLQEPWVSLAVVGLPLALWLWWPEPRRRTIAILCALAATALALWALAFPLLRGPRVVVLDVGQGDAILIEDGLSRALVDTGPDGACAEALAREGVPSLGAVILTHQHDDHAGGLDDLVGRVGVGRLYVPQGQLGALGEDVVGAVGDLRCDVCELALGDRISVGRFTLEVLWPEGPEDGDENDESLVLGLSYDEGGESLSGLLTGDAESDVLRALDERGRLRDIDFLKVGHHGSEVSVDEASAERLRAEVAVASAGEGNSYGHPRPECVEVLEAAGTRFLSTIDAGDVTVMPGASGPRLRTAT